ncbi:hypothetical protein LTR86_010906 [Recurvomyces mirabilis]|nr:hypothetical protein LTR86_010906 [Recurvomyces mirabilis]
MSLLTLIILGEGVMGLAKQCQSIVRSEVFTFSSSTIGDIVSAVLILYFIYMLYFDWLQEEHFGTVRQQIWAFMHFPLHLMLVLAVEGVAQSIAWNAAVVENTLLSQEYSAYNLSGTDNHIYPSWHNISEARWVEIAGKVNDTAIDVLYNAMANSKKIGQTFTIYDTLTQAFNGTALIAATNQTGDYKTAVNAITWIYGMLGLATLELAGFAAPEANSTSDRSGLSIDFNSDATFESTNEETNRVAEVYVLTFIYLFVAIGWVVLVCTFLAALSKKEKMMMHYIRLGVSGAIGLGLCLVAAIAVASTDVSNS